MTEIDHAEISARLEKAARNCGLYVSGINITAPPHDHDEEGNCLIPEDAPPMVAAAFDVGSLAFTNRVLDPEAEQTSDTFREIVVDDHRDQRDELRKHGTELTGALAELDEDDDVV